MKRLTLLFVLTSAIALSGCGEKKTPPSDAGINILATTTMLQDMTRAIAGDHAKVVGMMGPGQDPHGYKPTFSDVEKLHRADLIVLNGHLLEGQMGEALEGVGRRGEKAILAVAEKLPKKNLIEPPTGGHADPHVWGDVKLWSLCVPMVTEALSKLDPDNKPSYEANAETLLAQFENLHAWIAEHIRTLPKDKRVLITSHDAFNYLGRAYGIEVLGVQGVSTETEAGLADISRTVDIIRDRGVRAIFPESSVSPAVIERICEASGAIKGDELFSDALGIPGETFTLDGQTYDKGTYEGMMRYNISTIVRFLSPAQ